MHNDSYTLKINTVFLHCVSPQECLYFEGMGGESSFITFTAWRLLLTCDGNAGNSFPTTQGKDPSSRARRRKRVSSGCGQDSRASSSGDGNVGELHELQQGCEGPFGSSRC